MNKNKLQAIGRGRFEMVADDGPGWGGGERQMNKKCA